VPKMIQPHPVQVFTFAELSDNAKQHVLSKYAYDFADLSMSTECYAEMLKAFGFENVKIWYSVGYCQSDFASFDGTYTYRKAWRKAFVKDYGKDNKYLPYFDQIAKIMRKYFYDFRLTLKTRHDSPDMEYDCLNNVYQYRYQDIKIADEVELLDSFRSICKELYDSIRNELEYQTSEDYFTELADDNEWVFLESGEMFSD
jgi:hypothetical protein